MKKYFVVIMLLFALTACDNSSNNVRVEKEDTVTFSGRWGDVERIIDDDAGVVCWIYTSESTTLGSIDCMLLSDTLLDQ